MKKRYIYALDLSMNSSGVCIFTTDGIFVKSLTISPNKNMKEQNKLRYIAETFSSLVKEYYPEVVIIEQGFTLFNKSTQVLFKVHGIVNYIFSPFEQIYYPPSTIKKTVAGKGNINKEELNNVIRERYPNIKLGNLDESDAFAVGATYFIKKGIYDAPQNI